MGSLFAILFASLGIIAAVTLGAIFDGWALAKLWTWFIVPLFRLPILSIPQSIGIGLVGVIPYESLSQISERIIGRMVHADSKHDLETDHRSGYWINRQVLLVAVTYRERTVSLCVPRATSWNIQRRTFEEDL